MRIRVAHGSYIDKVLTELYYDKTDDDNDNFRHFVESSFSNYIQECTYRGYTLEDYEIVFKSEQKMTEFLLKWS